MKASAMRKNAENTINALEGKTAGSWDEAAGMVASQMAAERNLELCDIFDRLTDDEKTRLAAIPAYEKDLRSVADLRAKYSLSWNELRQLHGMAR